jgi:mycothiol synthase
MAWRLQNKLSESERLGVLALLNQKEASIGRESIDESRKRVIIHHREADHWLLENERHDIVGYAQVNFGTSLVGESCGGMLADDLVIELCKHYNSLSWWIRDATAAISHEATRRLWLMELSLPTEFPELPDKYYPATFNEVSAHEWLEHNNRSFADHPEQGAWNPRDLQIRVTEPWFDPSGFLLLKDAQGIAASCWTKIHELSQERTGEIYVISVDPRARGKGLGKIMLLQGLASLWNRGVRKVMLFVDADNTPAVSLYESIGFKKTREDCLINVGALAPD